MSTQVMEQLKRDVAMFDAATCENVFAHFARFPVLTSDQQRALVELAWTDDSQARHLLILGTLRIIAFRTKRSLGGEKRAWDVDFEDVLQQTYLYLLEHFERLLGAGYPRDFRRTCAYMGVCAHNHAQRYIRQTRSFVQIPNGALYEVSGVESLSVPGWEGSEEAQENLLEAPDLILPSPSASSEMHASLYQAIGRLPLRQRQAFIEFYRLEADCGSVAGGPLTAEQRANLCVYARASLRKALHDAYPQYAGEYRRVQERPAYLDVVIRDGQLQRLQQAYQELCGEGKRVAGGTLARKAGVDKRLGLAYLARMRQGAAA